VLATSNDKPEIPVNPKNAAMIDTARKVIDHMSMSLPPYLASFIKETAALSAPAIRPET
jgi:hypothetical protein